MNYGLEWVQKAAVMLQSRYYLPHGTEENHDLPIRIASVLADN
jgi:hypothetical protein